MHGSLVARAVTLGLVDPRRLGRLTRRVRRRAGELPACDLIWAEELIRSRCLTRYQAAALLRTSEDETGGMSPSRSNGAAAMPLKIGPYVVLAQTGRSDLGATYRCKGTRGREHVAVKVIDPKWTVEAEACARMEEEASSWTVLTDARVVGTRRMAGEEGVFALVSRWIAARRLADLVRAGRRLSPPAAISLVRQLIATLAAADVHGLVHGDLKPANVLTDHRGRAYLIDCGVRRSMFGAGLLVARELPPERYDYVAPEVAAGEQPPDAASDIYSLGCLLYTLVAGRTPYFGGSAERKMNAHRTGRLADLRSLGIEAGPDVRLLLQATLQPERCRRAESYNDLLNSQSRGTARATRRLRAELRAGSLGAGALRQPSDRRETARAIRPWSRWLFWMASAAATVAAVMHGSARVLPLLSFRVPARSETTLAKVKTRPNGRSRESERTAVTALWNATEDLRRAYHDSAPHDTITLRSPGPFRLDAIEIHKPITLRGAKDVRPLFVGGPGTTLRVAASETRLENLHFLRVGGRSSEQTRPEASPLVEASASRLAISNCSFQDLSDRSSTAIRWRRLAGSTDLVPAALSVRHVFFRDVARAVSVSGPGGAELSLENCLHLGPGPLVHSASEAGEPLQSLDVTLSHDTVFGAGTLVHSFPHPLDNAVPLRIVARDSFLMPIDREQPMAAVHYAMQPALLMPKVTWSGSGAICPADATLLEVSRGPDAERWRATDFATWQKYWGTHSTGLLGVRCAFPEGLPETPSEVPRPPAVADAKPGADASKLSYPPPVALEQLPVLIERLGEARYGDR